MTIDDDYLKKLIDIHRKLGIPEALLLENETKIYYEYEQKKLARVGKDYIGRDFFLTSEAKKAWLEMQKKASTAGINILAVSAFRSLEYQSGIIAKKLNNGLSIEEILLVNAAPGLSEHHTAKAVDITTNTEDEALTESFEETNAFVWLSVNAIKFKFYLSYPRNNNLGFIYEPWHWCYKG